MSDREIVTLGPGQEIELGGHRVTWFDAPHVPHGWECGFLGEVSTRTLFCGDLFIQGGSNPVPLTESDVLGPSEADRAQKRSRHSTRDGHQHRPHPRHPYRPRLRMRPKAASRE